jgi:23S rRNA (guanosine2251-2'-O)-methyltransferase
MKKPPFRLIMGKNTVEELLRVSPDRIVTLYLVQGVTLQEPYNGPKKSVSKGELTQLVSSDSHQGVVAAVQERGGQTLRQFCEAQKNREKSLVLILDSILDPHNFGAILRAAECFGADAVIYSKNRGVEITPTVSKVSNGATELVPLVKVSNLAECVATLQENDFHVIAAEAKEGSQSLQNVQFPKKCAIILGSEGKGIQNLLSKRADSHLMIPMLGQIDSLNVSQAAAVFLSFYRLQNN